MVLKRIESFLKERCSFNEGQRILVALSGGADSMMLVHVLKGLGIDVIAAHCNFKLRGAESDKDELFVQEEMKMLGVELVLNSFNTTEYASNHGVSIEMAARELRYNWFNALLKERNLDWIATGHHKDDSIETFFLNLLRGTGIKGLSGINTVSGRVIRPLLCLTRQEVENYCSDNSINYRTDSSNLEMEYTRNKIRNQIVPLFKKINPSFNQTMQDNMCRIKQVEDYVANSINQIKEGMVVEQDDQLLISLRHIDNFIDKELVLFEILQPYGFNGAVVSEIVSTIDHQVSGKQFYSETYRLIKDRQNLIIVPLDISLQQSVFYLDVDVDSIDIPISIKIDKNIDAQSYDIEKNNLVAQFDAELLDFPLTLRKWKQGDQFRPLGMKHFKKLSDFFIDSKFSIKDKEDVWLLLSGDDIIWIVGYRTDDRYKISAKTKKVTRFLLRK